MRAARSSHRGGGRARRRARRAGRTRRSSSSVNGVASGGTSTSNTAASSGMLISSWESRSVRSVSFAWVRSLSAARRRAAGRKLVVADLEVVACGGDETPGPIGMPRLLGIGPLPIRAYAICILAGVIVALLVGDRRWADRGGERGVVFDIALWAVIRCVRWPALPVLTDSTFGSGDKGLWPHSQSGWRPGHLGCRRPWRRRRLGSAVGGGEFRCRRSASDRARNRAGAGDRPDRQLLQPGAVRPGDHAAVGAGDLPAAPCQRRARLAQRGLDRRDCGGTSRRSCTSCSGTSWFSRCSCWWTAVTRSGMAAIRVVRGGILRGPVLRRVDARRHATLIAGIRINSFMSVFVFLGAVVYIMVAPKGREDPSELSRRRRREGGARH